MSLNGRLFVSEDVSLNKDLLVGDKSSLHGDVSMNGRLDVAEDVSMNKQLQVSGGAVGNVTGNLTGNVTGNVSGTAATVTSAAQSSITTLAGLTAAGARWRQILHFPDLLLQVKEYQVL